MDSTERESSLAQAMLYFAADCTPLFQGCQLTPKRHLNQGFPEHQSQPKNRGF